VWVRIDDRFSDHPKVLHALSLSRDALTVWLRAACWSSAHLTDGHLPQALVSTFPKAAAAALIQSGLWDITADGVQIHDWSHYQPSREAVLKKRTEDAARTAQRPQAKLLTLPLGE
jgi:hypothetical protein